jgi:hypothetical protein
MPEPLAAVRDDDDSDVGPDGGLSVTGGSVTMTPRADAGKASTAAAAGVCASRLLALPAVDDDGASGLAGS